VKLERRLLRLLHIALRHIETELDAAGSDEVAQHPFLRAKQDFVTRTREALREIESQ
jgi:hypothetical protein